METATSHAWEVDIWLCQSIGYGISSASLWGRGLGNVIPGQYRVIPRWPRIPRPRKASVPARHPVNLNKIFSLLYKLTLEGFPQTVATTPRFKLSPPPCYGAPVVSASCPSNCKIMCLSYNNASRFTCIHALRKWKSLSRGRVIPMAGGYSNPR